MNIIRLQRSGEEHRFAQWQRKNQSLVGVRRLLWHGSPIHNFIGILGQGLRTGVYHAHAPAEQNPGIFFADFAGKSMGFCRSQPGDTALMLLCEVELGKKNLPYGNVLLGKSGIRVAGALSEFVGGRGRFEEWKDAKCIHRDLKGILVPKMAGASQHTSGTLNHNEYIVYDPAQVRQRYLVQFKIC
ncbi:hypothetical protein N7492_000312 [Penicillium capsulatum]|uniref:Poly [ADP-ribose] polymerase n=1 Tax=Penicillium capsulatum TaxID=69766 RepID=A0A9W9LYF3_9EURO|nr:hypothetical protein N7492_000312 [Penicillium capsulatum]KAJ6130624.1 hypothetical protein N7512_003404 [Penicillium capsulatum]